MVEGALSVDHFKWLNGVNPDKNKEFTGVEISNCQEQDAIACNGTLTVWPWNNSAMAVYPSYEYKKFEPNVCLLKAHKDSVTDMKFNPFMDQMLGSSSKDGSVKLWMLGTEAPKDHNTQPVISLEGHSGAVLSFQWHHLVSDMLASVGSDKCVRVWDVQT